MTTLSRQRRYQLRKQQQGICVTCNRRAEAGQTRCQSCAATNYTYQKELREMMRSVLTPVTFDKCCQYCGEDFRTIRADKIYCSTKCTDAAWNETKKAKRQANKTT